jgi:hypothetical protein
MIRKLLKLYERSVQASEMHARAYAEHVASETRRNEADVQRITILNARDLTIETVIQSDMKQVRVMLEKLTSHPISTESLEKR